MVDSKPTHVHGDATSYLNDRPPQYTQHPPAYSQYGPSPLPGFQPYPVQNAPGPSPLPGFQPYPVQNAPGPLPNYGATTVVLTQPRDIIVVGGCPACRVGVLEDDFTCLGIFCAIFFFPIGILCCLALKDKRCSNCGAYFG